MLNRKKRAFAHAFLLISRCSRISVCACDRRNPRASTKSAALTMFGLEAIICIGCHCFCLCLICRLLPQFAREAGSSKATTFGHGDICYVAHRRVLGQSSFASRIVPWRLSRETGTRILQASFKHRAFCCGVFLIAGSLTFLTRKVLHVPV